MRNTIILSEIENDEKSLDNDMSFYKCVNRLLKESGTVILIALMFITGTLIALCTGNLVKNIMINYSYDVLIILVFMELFTGLIAETGIMQLMAVKLVELSNGRKKRCLVLFGILMFLISCFLNNITAVMMILPVVFILLKTIETDERYISLFFGSILALSNTGGAASPVGDFPAIVIMTSGITDFISYFSHAFPLFAVTSAVLIMVWASRVRKESEDDGIRSLAILNIKSKYRNITVRYDVLKWLTVIFVAMFISWSFIPQEIIPPAVIAVIGYVCAAVICSVKKVKVSLEMNLKSLLTIASFLFFAESVSETGILSLIADFLQTHISDPKKLVIVIMLITSIVAGAFSAGPAAAAMMPIIVNICRTSELSCKSHWIAVAYAAAICAGSSMFMWSATAGLILSGKVNDAAIKDDSGVCSKWSISQYWKYGFVNYLIQISIAIIAMFLIL